MNKIIPFSPPDITESEIEAVVKVLKSGWITTGAVNKEFEEELSKYLEVKRVKLLSSATSSMELALKIFEVGEGDEVIVPAYTYASTSNVAVRLGAKVVFIDAVDSKYNDFNMDIDKLEKSITEKTKAVISVDIGGFPCDYDKILNILEKKKSLFKPSNNKYQRELNRVLFLSDAAHSIGAFYKNKRVGSQADISSFSFHAVKNITTAEGGALAFNDIGNIKADDIYKEISIWALNGQNKSAFDKAKGDKSSWKYDIECIGYKCNMSDLHAAIGLSQLRRYYKMLENRKKIAGIYNDILSENNKIILPKLKNNYCESSYHLYMIRIKDFEEKDRDLFIEKMFELGIILNVHYLPLPEQKAYIDLGYNIKDYDNAYNLYKNEITLPLYGSLKEENAIYIADSIVKYLS